MAAVNAYIAILGFMVVFRSNQAWTRYWEGADLVLQARGSWVSATSSLIAFCSRTDGVRGCDVGGCVVADYGCAACG